MRWSRIAATTAGFALAASASARSVAAWIEPISAAPIAGEAALSAAQRAEIEAVVRMEMKRRAIPGLQIAIVRHGRVAFAGAYGVADLETGAAVTPDSLFTLNSSTKSFTGVAVMQLVQAGKLSLDTPAATYIDDLPPGWRTVTVRQLLTHVSGLPEILDLPNGQGTGTLIGSGGEASAWAAVKAKPIEAAPGARYRYNQTNYVLLGKIIDKVSGTPFIHYMATHEFAPAGAAHLVFGDARDVVPGRVRTYRYANGAVDGSGKEAPPEHAFDEFSPFLRTGGGLNGSASDVARWLIAVQNGTLLDQRTRAAMWTPGRFADGKPTPWSMGWPLRPDERHPAATGIGGRRSAFFVYPRDDLAIVVLTNLAGANPEEFIGEIAGVFYPELRLVNGGGLSPTLDKLRVALVRDRFAAPEKTYANLLRERPGFDASEDELNDWGGRLMGAGRLDEALAVFTLNTDLRPASANVWDSQAEALEALHRSAEAIASYRKSLKLDPTNEHAKGRLAALAGT